jgi:AcrR family transcriptional regulator
MQARADRQRATRDRIVAATVALHKAVGPARTTIAAIARDAGVQRLTVYNAFPTPRDLFIACQKRFLGESRLPDVTPKPGLNRWKGLEDALRVLYAWYSDNAAMERHIHRDRHLLPALDELMTQTSDAGLAARADAHATAIAGKAPSRALRAFVRLAFDFHTWDVLARSGLDGEEIARLMTRNAATVHRHDRQGRDERDRRSGRGSRSRPKARE